MRIVWTVARRELKALFDHPTGYILLVVFLVVNDFLFFRQAYLIGVASLRPMLDLLPWVLLFLVPAVTMRALAEDVRIGTLEVVLAQPITEPELVLGKYVGQLLFLWIALALTVPIPIGLSLGADLHAGVVVAQYVGAALFAAGLAGVGIWASSVTRNQITAFIVGVAVMFVLILVGLDPLVTGLPPLVGTIAQSLGVLSHFKSIARGVIDLRDAIYFATLAAVFLTLAYFALMRRKLSVHGAALRRLRLGTAILTAGLVVVNLFGRHIGGRLDLTPNKAYTLSPATKQLLGGLDELVTIKLFASRELPPQIALMQRDIDDLLSDLQAAGGDNVRVVRLEPGKDGEAEEQARALAIPPVQFNVVGEAEFQVKEGYLGIAVQYADASETIPFVQRTDDLEYRLASYVRSLTRTRRPVVGLIEQRDPAERGPGVQTARRELEQHYDVRSVTLSDTIPVPEEVKVLVLVGSPFVLPDTQAEHLAAFFRRGGGALIMVSGMRVEPQSLMASPMPVAWNRILEPFGVSIRPDMVYDLASNERVSVGSGFFRLLVNYPFWIRALSTRSMAINQEIEAVLLPWSSSIDTSKAVAGTVVPLFTTSRAGGVETGRAFIAPQRDFPGDDLAPQPLAVVVNPLAVEGARGAGAAGGAEGAEGAARRGAGEADSAAAAATPAAPAAPLRGRVVVVGSSEFVSDRFVGDGSGALDFVLNAVDWLAEDDALVAIRAKDRGPPPLVFESATKRDAVKYANVVGIPVLLVLAAAVWLWRRRRLSRQPYPGVRPAAARAEAT